jgi:hypothetical protein
MEKDMGVVVTYFKVLFQEVGEVTAVTCSSCVS